MNKTPFVQTVFDRVAMRYDLMNDLMSFGLHRLWKRKFVKMVAPHSDEKILDVAGGTGDIGFLIYKKLDPSPKNLADFSTLPSSLRQRLRRTKQGEGDKRITICDINPNMLEVGKKRAEKKGINIEWIEGNAEELPFDDNSFDKYTIVFGIRNVSNVQQALNDAARVLKNGGKFFCMEFHPVNTPIIKQLYKFYLFKIIPLIGKIVVGDGEPYEYLADSIYKFPTQEKFGKMLEEAGFRDVEYKNLMFGVVSITEGKV